jgi:TP901 family phage tail tape measure protein
MFELFRMAGNILLDSSGALSGLSNVEAAAGSTREKLNKLGSGMATVGSKMASVGTGLTAMITAPLVGLGVAAVKTSADFEAGMAKVQATSGASAKDMELLSKKAKEMGIKTKFSAIQATEALNYMAMAGWKTKDMMEGLEGIMNLAAASGEDLGMVSDIVTDGLTALGLSAKESGKLADVLAAAASNSNTNIAMMGETLKYAAPIFGTAGYNMKDFALAAGLMANAGIKASNSGTALRAGLTRLLSPPKKAAGAMDSLGISMLDVNGKMKEFPEVMDMLRTKFKGLSRDQQIAAADAIFGKTAMAGWLSVINASEKDVNKLSSAIQNSNGKALDMADIMNNTLSGQLTLLKSSLEGIAIQFGDIIAPYLGKLVAFFRDLSDRFAGASTHMKKVIVVIGLFAGAIGPILLFGGTLIGTLASLITVIGALSPPIIAVVGGIAILVTVFTSISTAIGIVIVKTGVLQRAFNAVKTIIDALKAVMLLDYNKAMKLLQENLHMSRQGAAKFINKLIELTEKINGIIQVFNRFKDILSIVKNIISNDYKANMDILRKNFELTEKEAAKLVLKFSDWKRKIIEVYTDIKDKLIKVLGFLFDKFLEMKTIDTSFLVDFIKGIINIKNKISEFAKILKDTFKDLDFSSLAESWNLLKSQAEPLMILFKGIGSIVKGILIVNIAILVGVINGLAAAFPYLLGVVTNVVNLILAILTGWIKLVKGIFTGDFNLIKAYFTDIWKAISGIFQNAVMAIGKLIGGFIMGVIKFFKTLYNTLVGHSIIPDMINAIVRWFKSLPSKVLSILSSFINSTISKFNSLKNTATSIIAGMISSLISKIGSFVSNFISKLSSLPGKAVTQFNNLKSKAASIIGGIAKSAYSWGQNLISSLIKGITSKAAGLKEALHNTAAKIKNFLGFSSPTKEGAGKDSDKWMPNLMKMLSETMLAKRGLLQDSVKKIAGDLTFDKISADIGVNARLNRNGIGAGQGIVLNINNPAIFDRRGVREVAEQIKTELQPYLNFKRG